MSQANWKSTGRFITTGSAILLACGLLAGPAAAQATDFKGRTLRIVVGFEAGGPYDSFARLVARHIGSHLAGNPTVLVQNMPGAGGLLASNHLYNIAPRDGTVLGMTSQNVALGQLLENVPGIKYDVRRFNWIGRVMPNVEVDLTWHTSKFRRVEDAKAREVVVAGTGPTSSSVVFRRLMNALIGTRFKIVTGYQGPASAQLALERGEVEAAAKIWSGVKSGNADMLRDGRIIVFLQYTTERYPDLADVQAVVELAQNEEQRQIFALFASGSTLGTSILAPPGVPTDVTAALRSAFSRTMHDAAMLDDLRKMSIDADPLPGDRVQGIPGSIFSIPRSVVDRAKQILQ